MAVYALKTFKFVLHNGNTIQQDRFVAAGTPGFGMFAFQFEPGFRMIEDRNSPRLKVMTSFAVCHIFVIKLFLVNIRMALRAGFSEAGKYSVRMRRIRKMAGGAALLSVLPLQGKISFTVVKTALFPARTEVTALTTSVGIPFFSNLSLVHIFMAIGTALPYLPELPALLFSVAGKTRRGHMRPFQWKSRLGMLF